MQHITSANIGSEKTQECIALARRYGVHVGAHPRHPIGRGEVQVTRHELETLLIEQVGQFGDDLHHIKLHGALYHASEEDPAVARQYVTIVRHKWPGVIIYAKCGGLVEMIARRDGPVWGEAFADRRYRSDGLLVPRSEPNALITDVDAAVAQAKELVSRLKPETLCVHSDTPNAVAIAAALKRMVRELRPSSRE